MRISKSPQNGGFQLITGGKVFDFIAARAAAAIPSALGVLAFLLFITYKKPFFLTLFSFDVVAKQSNWL
jgi:hypothetical protein